MTTILHHRRSKSVLWWIRVFLFLSCVAHGTEFDEERFKELVEKIEENVRELARKVEQLYPIRCNEFFMSACTKANYDHCLSSFPNPSCPGGDAFHNSACGEASTCSASYSYDSSVVILNERLTSDEENNNIPQDPQVIESICFSRPLDEYFITKRNEDKEYWKGWGSEPSAMYFASHTGAMRMYPARTYSTCGDYDPHVRDWYVSASSVPKDVVLVLDISRSMIGNKIDTLKAAAIRIINTLTPWDRIAIIPFGDKAIDITDNGQLAPATKKNIENLTNQVQELEVKKEDEAPNFYQAFEMSFDMLVASNPRDDRDSCNTAILFLSNGDMGTSQDTAEDVIELVSTRIAATEALLDHRIYLFAYSIENQIKPFPSQLACSVPNGVWDEIEDVNDIVESLSSYYKLFALRLGSDENQGFVSWAEPYVYASIQEFGTTASAPVYDRSQEPPIFLGVVAIDFLIPALDAALGDTNAYTEEFNKLFADLITWSCPRLGLGECVLESWRRQASCPNNNNCTEADFLPIEERCPTQNDDKDPWDNVERKGLSFLERACCRVGSTSAEDTTCPNPDGGGGDDVNLALILGATLGGVFGLFLGACFVVYLIGSCTDEHGSISINVPPEVPPYRGPTPHVPSIPPPRFVPSSTSKPATTEPEHPRENNNDPSSMENTASSNATSGNSLNDDVEAMGASVAASNLHDTVTE